VIFPSLVGKIFTGKVSHFQENSAAIHLNANPSPFPFTPFNFEVGETYTGIILEKTNTTLQIDIGYGFEWKRGSLVFEITRNSTGKNVDMFPQYSCGEEFDAVYVGKSISENDIFRYEATSYFSEEHNLKGQNVWAKLERPQPDFPCFQVDEKYPGELLMNEKTDWGISHELLQKTLQALPDGQRLWCKVVDVTPNGTLQLKWLVDSAPCIADVLSVHLDTSIFNKNDPFLSEKQKELINKVVRCEVCTSSYPKIFKVENQYTGIISMDAMDYNDIPLSLIIDTLSKLPDHQHILCKIKGIYPDETLKLQWMVQRDVRSQKLVFTNVFPQKIAIEKEKTIKKPVDTTTTHTALTPQWIGKVVEARIQRFRALPFLLIEGKYPAILINSKRICELLRMFPDQSILCLVRNVKNGIARVEWLFDRDPCIHTLPLSHDELIYLENIINSKKSIQAKFERTMIQHYLGKTLLSEVQKNENNEPVFLIGGKYIGRIVEVKSNYIEISPEIIKKMLQEVPTGQRLLCRIEKVLPDFGIGLRWMIDDDPFANELLFKHLTEVERTAITKQKTAEQYLGQTLLLEVQKDEHGEPVFWIGGKHIGRIIVAKYPENSHKIIKKTLCEAPEGQHLFCKVHEILPDLSMRLIWMIDDDPFADELRRKLSIADAPRKKEKKLPQYLTVYPLSTGVGLIGQTVQAKIINFDGNEPYCSVNNKHIGYLSIAPHLYHGLSRQTIKKTLQQLSTDDYITCQVIGVRPDSHLRLKWIMDKLG